MSWYTLVSAGTCFRDRLHRGGTGDVPGVEGGVAVLAGPPGRSGSIAILGSTTGGCTKDLGLGGVSGAFWMPGSIRKGGGADGGCCDWGV